MQSGAFATIAPALGTATGLASIETAQAQSAPGGLTWRHALSTFGDIKYPAGFKRYDNVNPDAPKGGVVRLFEQGTFDNFNIVVSGFKGSLARGAAMMVETLTTRSDDEVSTAYGLLADAWVPGERCTRPGPGGRGAGRARRAGPSSSGDGAVAAEPDVREVGLEQGLALRRLL